MRTVPSHLHPAMVTGSAGQRVARELDQVSMTLILEVQGSRQQEQMRVGAPEQGLRRGTKGWLLCGNGMRSCRQQCGSRREGGSEAEEGLEQDLESGFMGADGRPLGKQSLSLGHSGEGHSNHCLDVG